MPELPEVETIRLGLLKKIVGLKISDIQVLRPKSFEGGYQDIVGAKIEDVWRRGKVLGIDLKGLTLLIHLKMTGQLIYVGKKDRIVGGHPTGDMFGALPNSSTRVIFDFDDESELFFNDQRMFGWIKLVDSKLINDNSLLDKMGPEPLEEDFTWQILKKNLSKHPKTPVKVAIMDQMVVAGVGNIYANEACFIAQIDPRSKVKDLSDQDFKNLYNGTVESLKEGIKHGGSTRAHYVNVGGKKGHFLDYAYVYDKAKQKCKICSKEINKITLGGRGTFFCPNCQKPAIK